MITAPFEMQLERERARLVGWLAEHQVSVGIIIDREVTADALVADFIEPLLSQLQAAREGEEISDIMAEVGFRCMVAAGDERDALKAEICDQSQPGGLEAFAREIIGYAFEGTDADGASIQALALTHGLLNKTTYDPARHGSSMEAEPGDDWYVLAGPLALPLQPEGERSDA